MPTQRADCSLSPARGPRGARHPVSRRPVHEHGPGHRSVPHDAEAPPPVGAAPHAAVAAADAAKALSDDGDDEHEHYAHRAPWLRAGVLGANDGLVATASLMLGVGGGR